MNQTPQGITPPVPGQEKEEPDLWQEDDIPSDGNDEQGEQDQSKRSD